MTSHAELTRPLGRLRARLRGLVALRGGAWVVAAAAAILAGAYGLDRALDLPREIRLGILAVGGIGLAMLAFRGLARPLAAPLPHDSIALLVERAFPEMRERVVSAVQLSARPAPAGESEALQRLLREDAGRALAGLRVGRALDPRRAFLAAAGALGLAGALGVWFARDAAMTSVFFARLLGMERPWPRRTFLEIALPERLGASSVEKQGSYYRVRLPHGTDLPVRVLARGVSPPEVRIHVRGEKPRAATRTAADEFVFVFRSVIAPFTFHATGGDDDDEDPTVEVRPHRPPELASVAVDLTYPGYTGLPAARRDGGSFEALVGTAARLSVEGSAGAAKGTLRFVKTGTEIPLEASGREASFSAGFLVTESDRYHVFLEDAEGLRTSDPASYSVTALPDRRPELRVVSPDRSEFDATANGAFPIRASAKDDFGVATLEFRLRFGEWGGPEPTTLLGDPASRPADALPRREAAGGARVEVAALAVPDPEGARPPREGDAIQLVVEASDNRPEPNRAAAPPFRIVVQPPAEILRKLNDAIGRVREDVEALGRLQREKIDRLNDLVVAVEGDTRAAGEKYSFVSAAVGQARVGTQARRVEAEFLRAFETGAWNRLDRNADAAIVALEAVDAEVFAAAPSRVKGRPEEAPVAARAERLLRRRDAGELGALEFLGKFLDMLALAHAIGARLAPEASAALEEAATAVDPSKVRERLAAARATQDEVLATIDRLLLLLSEWDNYQAVVGLTREILERQRSLNQRTKEFTRRQR